MFNTPSCSTSFTAMPVTPSRRTRSMPRTPEDDNFPPLLLPSFASTESVYTLASPQGSPMKEHLAYPEALAQFTAGFLPESRSRPRRFRTTPDMRKKHLSTMLSERCASPGGALACSPSGSRRSLSRRRNTRTGRGAQTPPRQLSYQDMRELQRHMRRSPSLHAILVSAEEDAYTEEPRPLPLLRTPEPWIVPPTPRRILLPLPKEDAPPRASYRAYEAHEFDGWLKPGPPPSLFLRIPSELSVAGPSRPVSPLARSRALRRKSRSGSPVPLSPSTPALAALPAGEKTDPQSESESISITDPSLLFTTRFAPATAHSSPALSRLSVADFPAPGVQGAKSRSVSLPLSGRPRSRVSQMLGNVWNSIGFGARVMM